MKTRVFVCAALMGATLLPLGALASSHREAPFIAGLPRLDGTDFYMFRSYEPGRSGFVTLIANYLPLQDAYGGPNYFNLEDDAVYKIHIDNDGDAKSNLTFEFKFNTIRKNATVDANGVNTFTPLVQTGPVDANGGGVNVQQSYTITLDHNGDRDRVHNDTFGGDVFLRPLDNIGEKTIAHYADYASHFIYQIGIPGCATPGRAFVGQRKEGFVVNLGEVFDLVNLNPVGPRDGEPNTIADKNVTTLALEVPISCLTNGKDPVIGGWTTSSFLDGRQVSRLGMPLVNELIIGLPDKDKFNGSHPKDDGQFLHYVTNPFLPELLNQEFGGAAVVPQSPRNDLIAAFLTGVQGLNQPQRVTPGEMLRLNTSIAPTAPASQNDLGVLGADLGGFPNGRRPYDDVVDITLRVAEGALCGAIGNCGNETSDPNHGLPYTDGARAAGPDAADSHVTGRIKAGDTYLPFFPYLNTPIPGSPNGANGE
jgi:hypothetical protein